MTDRRGFLRAAANALLLVPLVAGSQEPATKRRIGILGSGSNPRSAPFFVTFERRLRELGWIDGQNLTIEFATGETSDQLSRLAMELVAHRVEVIVTVGPELGLQAARAATQTIPIVMVALNYDPVEKKHVASLARPGGDVTGVHFRNAEVGVKQLELLRVALPAASRVGILWTSYSVDQIPPIEGAALRLGLRLEKVELTVPFDVEKTIATLKAKRMDAVLAVGDPTIFRERALIGAAALQQKMPLVASLPFVDFGSLVAFGPDLNVALASGAEYVDKILRGAKPRDLPVEQPTKFVLVVNLKLAKTLGLAIPKEILLRADEVIQ